MAYHKKEAFDQESVELANIAKALSHPARIAILRLLAQRKSCICGDLVVELPLSQSTVSQHLKELKQAGLIKGDIDGPRVCYCLNGPQWQVARAFFEKFFTDVDACTPNCC
ncbi:metalloregulator ArsR/SmtB family transcription factor [Nibribacter ruber]|uniref:Metalloregulator ArsR/SmtB family transcription factor n=1 Tax=Nibribacter ruber TaxID=2698458 RepID=A0A6P1P1T0_9BACT|nr:metalloregulator ArsR/SmtB family transcription factor [Nibribacter ruber]QHL87752.1 metalloregulator ArsR/SmtB family transcription factor [Nibribacter ruber]